MSLEKKIVFILVFILVCILVLNGTLCISEVRSYCVSGKYAKTVLSPLFLVSISILITSIFTFLISDKIFKKWLKFTFWYFLISIIWIVISPESSGSFIQILDTKEQVSTFASVMFVIISLVMFIWMTIKEKKIKN